MSDNEIRELDDRTIEQIAAGEVVERPASAVKELVENSLDAGADRVDVTVEGGGTDRIAVADDGHGMGEADLRRAVRQHTTSKIGGIEDLETGVSTLGFRGEALSTIGAVSRLTITTRPSGADTGTRLEMAGGEVQAVEPAGRGPGTTVEVTDLFYNTPARRKFLKAESTEFGHVNRVVTRYALANPDVAMSLTHDGRETFATTGQGDRRGAIMSVYGRDVAESMREVEHDDAVSVHGYVSDPETTRSTREYLATYVNGRYVTDSTLREAILDAYGTQLAPDRFPFAVLFVAVEPDAVDVNVHPRKTAVRFDDERAVRDAVSEAVGDALLDGGLVRSGAPRGKSAPDDAPVSPERPDDDADDADDAAEPDESADTTRAPVTPTPDPERENETSSSDDSGGATTAESATRSTESTDRRFDEATENATLPGLDSTDDNEFDRLPALDVLGQLDDTYLVAETDRRRPRGNRPARRRRARELRALAGRTRRRRRHAGARPAGATGTHRRRGRRLRRCAARPARLWLRRDPRRPGRRRHRRAGRLRRRAGPVAAARRARVGAGRRGSRPGGRRGRRAPRGHGLLPLADRQHLAHRRVGGRAAVGTRRLREPVRLPARPPRRRRGEDRKSVV